VQPSSPNHLKVDLYLRITVDEQKIVQCILQCIIPHKTVWVIGSRITAKHKPYSDLDLLVMGDEELPLSATAALREAFSESDLPFKVDVVLWSALNDNFKQIFQQNHVVLQD
jgi:predicted nucleotidyltransferase